MAIASLPTLCAISGEFCGKHRVYRLMKQEGLQAQVGYRRKAGHYAKPPVVADNRLEQNFDVEAPNQVDPPISLISALTDTG